LSHRLHGFFFNQNEKNEKEYSLMSHGENIFLSHTESTESTEFSLRGAFCHTDCTDSTDFCFAAIHVTQKARKAQKGQCALLAHGWLFFHTDFTDYTDFCFAAIHVTRRGRFCHTDITDSTDFFCDVTFAMGVAHGLFGFFSTMEGGDTIFERALRYSGEV
jgi:hypothetical protein